MQQCRDGPEADLELQPKTVVSRSTPVEGPKLPVIASQVAASGYKQSVEDVVATRASSRLKTILP
jgi:hypothetical protein